MAINTDFMLRYNFAKFILKYVDYYGCASFDDRMKNGKIRKLGDLEEKKYFERSCQGILVPKNIPVCSQSGVASAYDYDEHLYTSAGLQKLFKMFYQGRLQTENTHSNLCLKKIAKGKSKVSTRRNNYISKLTKDFVNLISDDSFHENVKEIEGLTQVLGVMWHPTRPVESVGQYAIAKHASIHYILSTHAILPSAECFTPEDIQRIMHLPMEWIGALPRQEDTRCITKFIARFADLFARKPTQKDGEEEDPLDKHARRCGQRVFLDIIRFACDGTIPQKRTKRFRALKSVEMESLNSESDRCDYEQHPPLDWTDQLTRRSVKIVPLPKVEAPAEPVHHRFLRPVKQRSVEQNHVLYVPVNEGSVMKEAHQIMSSIEVAAEKDPQEMRRFAKSRALKRGARKISYPTMHDFCEREVLSVPNQIAREEQLFHGLVSNLPHRAYGIRQLEEINTSLLAGLKPARFDTSWLKDPVLVTPNSNWSTANQWDPNRRIHHENMLRAARLPLFSFDEEPTQKEPNKGGPSRKLQSLRHSSHLSGFRRSSLRVLQEHKCSIFPRHECRSEIHRSTLALSARFSQPLPKGPRGGSSLGGQTQASILDYLMTVPAANGQQNLSNSSNKIGARPFLPPISVKTKPTTSDLTAGRLDSSLRRGT